jgi:transcriptional regulator of aromatic amino acid metabolism
MFQDLLSELRRCMRLLPFNALILGTVTPEQRAEAVQELRIGNERDAFHAQRNIFFKLPIVSTTTIVVIDEVADLSTDDQLTLLQWLLQHRDAMVLSFAANPIFPLVAQGKFLDRLYYRLNVITLNVNDDAAWSSRDRPAGTKKRFIRPSL